MRGRLSREEKGKGVADSPSPTRDARVADSPPDDFDLIHRDALRDLDNMTLSQRLLVADAHKMICDECADRVEVGSSDVSGSGSEASSQASRSLRRASREIPFDQIDCRPTIYHPGGIFEELGPLPSELLRDPRAQSWGNAIAAHSHLCWPDLSREWIRRQEARIARVDWESRLPVVHGPRKSRLSLFTRIQQKLLDEARKMDGLSKKSIPADVQGSTISDAGRASKEGAPGLVDKDVGAEPPALSPKKKKKSKKSRRKTTEELPLEQIASLDETSWKQGRKREEGRDLTKGLLPPLITARRRQGSVESDRSEAAPEDRPRKKKKKKKKSIEAEPRPSDVETGLVEVVAGGDVSLETPPEEREVSARGSDPVTGERSIPDPSARKGSRSEGSTEEEDRVPRSRRVFLQRDDPLILNPLGCAELTRQIRGGTKEMPQLDDLYFKTEYIDDVSSRARVTALPFILYLIIRFVGFIRLTWSVFVSDGSMNFLVEKYDSTLKQTMIQLGSSEKLAQTRAEHKKANEKAGEEKEILRENGFDERPENENLKGFPGKDGLEMGDTLVREGETENVGVEDPVLVSDSSSEGREDGEEDNDGIEEASLPRPAEEETTYEAGDTDVPPLPVVDSLAPISTWAEDPTAAATKGPDDQDSVP
ncbi:LOW QUALITY PROTEIN: hypothetical protein HID58_065580 [Brassica napus]|uniref:Uncharacterized protein n=1 Tax=Brassica napus TaxID=3708 RepID=A0ABQ7ZD83_BRANA|nr:LOW QUALITY PROTEIN: hypothetical protein HID58_065580 [Brassica napus]